jgi:hypothetical protein
MLYKRREVWLKIIEFISNHIIQQTALLTNSTKILSFKGIQLSINHKSSSKQPWKAKLLNCAIHYHKILSVEHWTKRWLTFSSWSQNTHLESPFQPFFSNWSLVSILFLLSNHIKKIKRDLRFPNYNKISVNYTFKV